ncbi:MULTISPECIES: isochorismatase family protein [unclassified Beijerinckia]|uniref:isochorismatase family protein n=1 Tax=unclassified Beijerinckia TaxID=2638183 RepID=UPI000894B5D2|nr:MULTISPECIES: isochorismatase family protein [unclassified Beijerinckia]MDH7798826.1 maleamate amidohydrolase [Beijerinckia sp. GAS462]SED89643.1 Nicotinamidase-related amidase [Beijerinckia sp. 28-YEA-48]
MTSGSFEDYIWRDLLTPEMRRIYAHYERPIRIGKKPALVLVDLYNLVFLGGDRPVDELIDKYPSSCGEYAWTAIRPIQSLIECFRSKGLPVIHVTFDDRPETDHQAMNPTFRKKQAHDPSLFTIKSEFAPAPGEQFIYKKRASAFFGTPLATSLVQHGADTVVVAGETTSGCVRASTVDAFSHGFHAVLAEECVFDRSLLTHKINLFDLHHKYADVFHIDRLIEAVEQV